MKPLKFRVWNGKKMISPVAIDRDGIATWWEDSIPQTSDKIMQWTGLLDKEGKEIFEGDVVKCSGHEDLCVVYYDSLTASYISLPHWMSYEHWSNDSESDPDEYLLWDNINIQIVGNIYENKIEED